MLECRRLAWLLAVGSMATACRSRAEAGGRMAQTAESKSARLEPPVASQGNCLPVEPARLWLEGTLEQQVRLGPPGYGETPSKDERDTILVLRLRAPINVCADTTEGAEQPRTDSVTVLQLAGRIGGLASRSGQEIGVYGTLCHADFGPQFTDVLIDVKRVRLLGEEGKTEVSS